MIEIAESRYKQLLEIEHAMDSGRNPEQPTLRDLFAMSALSLISSPECAEMMDDIVAKNFEEAVAKAVYRISDAMLKQRSGELE